MTVEQFLRAFLADMTAKCNEAVDDAIDAVSLNHKRLREEVQEARHLQREMAALAAAASAPAGRGRAKTKAGTWLSGVVGVGFAYCAPYMMACAVPWPCHLLRLPPVPCCSTALQLLALQRLATRRLAGRCASQ